MTTAITKAALIVVTPLFLVWLAWSLTADRFGHFCAGCALIGLPVLAWAAIVGCPA